MNEESVTDALLRQFLLGQVGDEERQRIESLFMTDPQSRERTLAAEQDLIEDYLDDCLTTEDRERFLGQYADTPTQRRKLRITKSIKEWAVNESKVTRTTPSTTSMSSRLQSRLRWKPVFLIPITVVTMIAIMVAVVWVIYRNKQGREHLAVEQELARLNAPSSLGEVPPHMSSIALTPISVRGLDGQGELMLRGDIQIVELRLVLTQRQRYSAYRAEIRRLGDEKSYTLPELHGEGNGNLLRMRLPARSLAPGVYQIQLSGIAADGTTGPPDEYKLTVDG